MTDAISVLSAIEFNILRVPFRIIPSLFCDEREIDWIERRVAGRWPLWVLCGRSDGWVVQTFRL